MSMQSRKDRNSGFSLIEVMIAVVVLATGLLALAALQAKLTANSADSKARSRIAALLSSAIDDERASSSGYTGIASFGATSCTTVTPTALQTAICTAQGDASVTNLQLTQTVSKLYGPPTAGSFTSAVPAASVKIYGEYKLVGLSASWNDATGGARNLGMTTIVDQLGLTASSTLLTKPLDPGSSKTPVVHEQNPSLTPGVIPIAVGSNTDSASTNPKPTLGLTIPSTSFNTLTYTQGALDTSATSTIQKRVETRVAECACQNSTTNVLSNDVFLGTTTFRPTYWNGVKYLAPDVPNPPVVPNSAPYDYGNSKSPVVQDDICTQCCRDHKDTGSETVKYDPYTGNYNKYKAAVDASTGKVKLVLDVNGAPVVAGNTDPYLDACRVIRVDGLWRVAADMNAQHMGLIATDTNPRTVSPASPVPPLAKSWIPIYSAAAAYEDFVLDYLGQILPTLVSGGSPPAALASTVFDNHGLNNPTLIGTIGLLTDFRYLHGRGLYLDHLEQPALDKLNSIYTTCNGTSNYPQCLLPYLPFNTINVTELANWNSSDKTKLNVYNGSTQCTAGAPIRGCVTGVASGDASANTTMGKSNSAVASSLAKSPYELDVANILSDSQPFRMGGTSTSSEFFVMLAGLSQTSNLSTNDDPSVRWGFSSSTDSGGCFTSVSRTDSDPNPYDCVTTLALTLPVNTTVGSYNRVVSQSITNPCGGTATVSQPVLVCNTVTGATVSPSPGLYNTGPFVVTGTGTGATTLIPITANGGSTTSLAAGATMTVTFGLPTSTPATYQCDNGNPVWTTPTSCP